MFSPRSIVNKNKRTGNEKSPQAAKAEAKLLKRNISYETDESIRSALIEICIYIVFMVATTVMANTAHHLYMFYFNQTMERSFIERFLETELGTEFSFNDLVTTADWWLYMERIFLANMHGLQHVIEDLNEQQANKKEIESNAETNEQRLKRQNDENDNGDDDGNGDGNDSGIGGLDSGETQDFQEVTEDIDDLSRIYLRDNLLLGPPRLRQIRVQENSCQVHDVFLTYFTKCFAGYSQDIEHRSDIYMGSKFYTMSELQVNMIHGQIRRYYGAGYVYNLTYDHKENLQLLQKLKDANWIDRATRLVILEFVLFNINTNIFNNVKIIAEIPPVGCIVPSHQFQALKLHTLWTEGDWPIYLVSAIFYALILYYTIVEIIQFSNVGAKKYFFSMWNILDILVLMIAYLALIYNLLHPLYLKDIMQRAKSDPNAFISIDYICFWNLVYIDMMGIVVFLVWIKMFKYISFNKTMMQFSTTLRRCAKDLFGFAVMFFIVFLAYAQLGLLIFGSSHPDFRAFGVSVITLMRMFLGDFEYNLIEEANQILGPIYFLTYVLFVFFILLNMFLAIINDTYGAVKSEVLKGRSHFCSYLFLLFKKTYSWCCRRSKVNGKTKETSHELNEREPTAPIKEPSSGRIQKRASEILREYFEVLPADQVPQKPAGENLEYKRLNNRIALLEEALEHLINSMDRILEKTETKVNKNKKSF